MRTTTWVCGAFLGGNRKRRIRLQQLFTTLAIYLASAAAMWLGVGAGLVPLRPLLAWIAFVLCGIAVFFVAIRSGWSERRREPALTTPQIVFGMLTVVWGYAMCGEVRSATVFPMMLILTFGAFSLTWRKMAALTGLSLALLAGAMAAIHLHQPGRFDMRLDLANLIIAAIMLPASCAVAGRLSMLRGRLREQRGALAGALQKIERLAARDELTGLINRRRMGEILEDARRRSVRDASSLSIALLDLDHFKSINDRFGHRGGDEVLKTFAATAAAVVRGTDVLARWGGEEFLLMAPGAQPHQVAAILERLSERLAQTPVEGLDREFRVTFSAGVARYSADDDQARALERADRALYRAKSDGRDRIAIAEGVEAVEPVAFDHARIEAQSARWSQARDAVS